MATGKTKPTQAEIDLCRIISEGGTASFAVKTAVRAWVIRRLILRLAIDGKVYSVPPSGIVIENVVIKGPLRLDGISEEGGGPIFALSFVRCRFEGGFSGRNSSFRHLCFTGSAFVDRPAGSAAASPKPSIDLSGATVDSDLIMDRMRPEPGGATVNHLWIRAPNLTLKGSLRLDRSHMRAPAGPRVEVDEWKFDGINLMLARIRGDLTFLRGGRCVGRFNLRSAEIGGDVWLSGATLENPGSVAFFAQGAHFCGLLMLTRMADSDDPASRSRPFRIKGDLSLISAQVGRSVQIAPDADPAWAPDHIELSLVRVGEDLTIGDGLIGRVGKISLRRAVVEGALQLVCTYSKSPGERRDLDFTLWDLQSVRAGELDLYSCGSGAPGDDDAPISRSFGGLLGRLLPLSIDASSLQVRCATVESIRLRGALSLRSLRCDTDVTVAGQIVQLDLKDATVGNSLDLISLRLVDQPGKRGDDLDLFDARIGRAIKLVPDEAEPSSQVEAPVLVLARLRDLRSLPGTQLIETLWFDTEPGETEAAPPRDSVFQVGFLYRDYKPTILDGSAEVLRRVREDGGEFRPLHFGDAGAAEEYLRLHCRYVLGDQGPFTLIDRLPGGGPRLPVFVKEKRPAEQKKVEEDKEAIQSARREFAAIVSRYLANEIDMKAFEKAKRKMVRLTAPKRRQKQVLTVDQLAVPEITTEPDDGGFRTIAPVLYGAALFETEFEIKDGPELAMVADDEFDLELEGLPRFEGPRVRHPSVGPTTSYEWVMPEPLEGMAEVPETRRRLFEFMLRPLLYQTIHANARVDLRDCECETLQDGSGRAWGDPQEIQMDHFQYGKTLDSHSKENEDSSRRAQERRRAFGLFRAGKLAQWRLSEIEADRGRGSRPLSRTTSLLFALLRLLPFRKLFSPNLLRTLIQHEEATGSGWRARRNWIFRQFPDRYEFLSISRYRVRDPKRYHPQPFEQAIKVARREGRRSDAVEFAILKRRLEWSLFSRQWRPWFAAAGAVIGVLVALLGTSGGTRAVIMGAGIGLIAGYFVSSFFDFFLDRGFGYMMKSLNAAVTLILLFLVGWWGTSIANANKMLVLAINPVAVAARQVPAPTGGNNDALEVGMSISAKDQPANRLPCGPDMRESIYALDVLIPLVDLHEEDKCEIGRVRQPPRRQGPVEAEESWFAAHIVRSEQFWSAMKAIYALLGWIVVSLSILTFANVARSGMEGE